MTHPIWQLEQAALAMLPLSESIVFTGGATLSLYLDEVTAADVRPTNDVDCVVKLTSRGHYYQLAEQLRQLGLQECLDEGSPLCRWRYQELIIDIMPTDPDVLGFSNRWYEPAMTHAILYSLPSGRTIQIFSVAYFLASKIEAFQGRGNRDFYGSTDFEDIVMLLDGCPSLEEQIQSADLPVRAFIQSWLRNELANLVIYAPAHLSLATRQAGREAFIIARINRLANSSLNPDEPNASAHSH